MNVPIRELFLARAGSQGLAIALLFAGLSQARGQAPSAPPDITLPAPPASAPTALGASVIPPFQLSSPESTKLAEGLGATLAVVDNLGAEATYQWFKDGRPIDGATDRELNLASVVSADSGEYSVVVTAVDVQVNSTAIAFKSVSLAELADSFSPWIELFYSQSEINGFAAPVESADPDQDGLSNLLEYALALDPTRKDAPPEGVVLARNESGALVVRYERASERSDLSFVLQISDSLVDWSDVAPEPGKVDVVDDGGAEMVSYDVDSLLADAHRRRFIRLLVKRAETPVLRE